MRNLVVLCAVLAFAGACKKKQENKAAPPPPPPPVTADAAGATADKPPAGDPKVIERGAYIAKASGCLVCHTAIGPTGPDLANAGAGGLELPEAFGIIRTPNITFDKGTGLGNWTDDQVIAAIREGVRPDGKPVMPFMPYMNYNVMTDDDAKALVAFLKTLKPVERVNKPSELKHPMPPIPVGKPANKKPGDDPQEQGAYYASLMLCNHCHFTPKKGSMEPAGMDKMYSGGLAIAVPPMMGTGTLTTPNITSDPETGIGKWTEEQIFTTLKTMTKPDGKMIQGPMLFMQMGWSQMDEKDIKNVAAFIKKLPPVKNKVAKGDFKPAAGPPGGPPGGGPPGGGPPGGSAPPDGAPGTTKGGDMKGGAKAADPHKGHDMKGSAGDKK